MKSRLSKFEIMEIAIVVGLLILVFGFIIGTTKDKFGAGSKPTPNQAQRDCESAKIELAAMHSQVCEKEQRVLATREIAKAAATDYARALASAVALSVAAGLASLIPVIGQLIASGLASSAVAAFAYSSFLLGAAQTASVNQQNAEAFLAQAKSEKQKAIEQLRKVCGDSAQVVIDALPPC